MSKTKTGFTLIELLVVIATIALLAAILFPVFARARENARKSACLNNMKQIGLAMAQYTQDFDETFPHGILSSPASTRLGIGWAGMLRPYTKSAQLFSCANDRPKGIPVAGSSQISYAFNRHLATLKLADIDFVSKRVMHSEVKVAFNVILSNDSETGDYKSPVDYGDNLAWLTAGNVDRCCGDTENTPAMQSHNVTGKYYMSTGSNAFAANVGRHLDGANFLLADGHVKWYRGENVTSLAANTNASQVQISYYRP